ncbi:hypothetical protein M2341_002943 [Sphingobium sp. B7D2B]|uniref:DUF5343 domain-containing protein n=1 Tax=Sphingobium sp. B7D2B TaxID=2940583 RepID=UPI002225000E|nr:DUF5343 domain-containing protein [Sphingobium sp. B7D2B]MCW2367496.1 hypothetical protein [Sphingobium sp. B7D2B]
MPVTVDQPAPYAPASAILELIERHRNKGLPPVVDADVLARAGISDSLIPRTLQALKTLDLLTDDGRPSEVFEGIRLAPTAEYQQRLSEWLNGAYADALSYVDPTTDDEVAMRDAFRKYIPTGQQGRMVTLFMGLFTAAGVMPPRAKALPPPKRTAQASGATKSKPGISNSQRTSVRALSGQRQPPQDMRTPAFPGSVPPAIAGLLASLPANGRWTQAQRDKFMTAFPVMLDFAFEIVSEAETVADDKENGD